MRTDEPRAVRLAEYRPPEFRISEIALDFALDPEKTRVKATTEIARTGAADAPLVLDGEQLTLVSVAIDGRSLDASAYATDDDSLTIFRVPDRFTLEIVTEINPLGNTALQGLYLAKDIFCTQCEAEGFRRITYYPDRPDVLARYTVRIEAEKSAYPVLLSNGNCTLSGDLPGGRHFAVWRDPFPKPSYLFALVAGDLGVLRDEFVTMSGRRVALAIYVEHGNEPRVTYAMDALKRSMRWDEEKYGCEYDLDIFMIVAVSAFNAGAMENKGLNIFNDALLLASPETATDADYARIESVVAHEYFHNWTGDRITCRDWFQLSLKEGLTVFRDQEFSADMRSRAVNRIEDVLALRARQFQEDAGPLAHPVQPDAYLTIDNFYTATIYEKGSEVIGMLKTLVGDEGYRKATDLYFKRHDGEAATVEDWVKCFEDANGRDLSQFRLWYKQAGTPTVEADGVYDEAGRRYTLTLRQSLAPTPGQPEKKPMQIPVRLGFVGESGALPLTLEGENAVGPDERVLELTKPEQRFVFVDVDEAPLLSVGRGFSAPATFRVSHDRKARAALMAKDSDSFNRWESGRELTIDVLLEMSETARAGGEPKPDPIYLDAVGAVLARAKDDPAFAALMLMPPSEGELAQQRTPVDPDAIHAARESLIRAAASVYGAAMTTLYRELAEEDAFSPDAASAGRRSLRNTLLRFLTAAEDDAAAELSDRHYRAATNMTDMVAGLAALGRTNSALREAALANFYDRFRNDPLVLDKWLGLQASSPLPGALAGVKALMRHPFFDIKNPNRVRSLLGAFAGNQIRFHARDGSGYQLLAETIRTLDALNPTLSSRMVVLFENWRRYDGERQRLMRGELETMANMKGLSTNLYEMVTKLLG